MTNDLYPQFIAGFAVGVVASFMTYHIGRALTSLFSDSKPEPAPVNHFKEYPATPDECFPPPILSMPQILTATMVIPENLKPSDKRRQLCRAMVNKLLKKRYIHFDEGELIEEDGTPRRHHTATLVVHLPK